jgi:uncharacterized membrane protein YphA (DoxX/SURF4 family)
MSATSTTGFPGQTLEMPAWKSTVNHVAAAIVGIIFLATGLAKIVFPFLAQQLFEQMLVPTWGSMPLVIALGIAETLGGALVLIPRYRRWGALVISLLLVIFMIYVGARYQSLVGKDCSCFPWLKRTVNPAFFAEDGAMLVAALAAAWLSRRPASLRIPAMILAGVAVLSGASYGYNVTHQSGIQVPETITVEGQPYSLHKGRIFLFFYDPTCSHCDEAARHMATYHWKSDITVIGLPTNDLQWGASFMKDTKLSAKNSSDAKALRKLFTFSYPPYGVALDRGRVKGVVAHYDAPEPEPSLKQLGYVD